MVLQLPCTLPGHCLLRTNRKVNACLAEQQSSRWFGVTDLLYWTSEEVHQTMHLPDTATSPTGEAVVVVKPCYEQCITLVMFCSLCLFCNLLNGN